MATSHLLVGEIVIISMFSKFERIDCVSYSFVLYIIFKILYQPGYYANGTGSWECTVCSERYECLNSPHYPVPCEQGYYCHQGDSPEFLGVKQPCPKGTYGATELLSVIGECTKCPGRRFCSGVHLTNDSGLCDAGYWCKEGASSSTPDDDPNNKFGKCPTGGFYCPQGSFAPIPCPAGRYSPAGKDRLKSVDECDECLAGQYCELGTQTSTTGPCDPGYFCLKGSPTKQPNTTHGGICPAGTHCPSGSSWPIPCTAGTYNNLTQQATCKTCPAGFYCPDNSTNPLSCPPGYWCGDGTKSAYENACPEGTFNNLVEQPSPGNCVNCTAGFYCDKQGKFLYVDLFFQDDRLDY